MQKKQSILFGPECTFARYFSTRKSSKTTESLLPRPRLLTDLETLRRLSLDLGAFLRFLFGTRLEW